MSAKKISIVDYGIGNLFSVVNALEYCGATTEIISSPEEITEAKTLLLPGVGAFADGMKQLHAQNLVDSISQFVKSGKKFLGICLGMQLMMDGSEEHGATKGLGLIKGQVKLIPKTDSSGNKVKVPNVGWRQLLIQHENSDHPVVQGIDEKSSAYFVHSFAANPDNLKDRLIFIDHYGHEICAAITHDNCTGFQFHPERSAQTGLKILKNYIQNI